jgi:hypothetical protein
MKKTITTPKGIAKYPHVNEPNTRFNPMGEYSCSIVVSDEDGTAFRAKIEELFDAEYERECIIHKKKLKKSQHFPVAQDEDGQWLVKTKQVSKVETKSGDVYTFDVKLFDASGQPVKSENCRVGSGSQVRCSIEPRTWYNPSVGFGMTLSLRAVQVIELVESSGGSSADSFGFDAEEGFKAETFNDVLTDEPIEESIDF